MSGSIQGLVLVLLAVAFAIYKFLQEKSKAEKSPFIERRFEDPIPGNQRRKRLMTATSSHPTRSLLGEEEDEKDEEDEEDDDKGKGRAETKIKDE